MTMDRVYNQQQRHGFQPQHTQSALLHHNPHQNQNHYSRLGQQTQQSTSTPSPPPPPPPPPSHMQQRPPDDLLISIQQPNRHLYRPNQFMHGTLTDPQQQNLYYDHVRQSGNINVQPLLHRPVHPPPPPPSQPSTSQPTLLVAERVPNQSHFMPPMMTAKRESTDATNTNSAFMRNSLPAILVGATDVALDHTQKNSLQHGFYANTRFQYHEPTNLKRYPNHQNRHFNQQKQPQSTQIDSHTTSGVVHHDEQILADTSLLEQTDQHHYLEEVILAIVAARSALEKPIEERDEHDILSIDNLCSLLHGFLAFPKSVRRALAAQTVLIVIDEKGKELIVHNEELDSFCVLIFGECEQLNETKSMVLRNFNVGDAFGVCEPTTDTIRFFGHMVTKCENCAFLCVKRDDFYTILTDPANYPTKGTIRHRDRNGNVVCISQFDLDRKTTGPLWSYHMQSKPYKIILPNGHVIIKATEACLLTALVDGYERMDPDYIDDFLLLFRVFMTWDPKDREKKLPPGMIKLCLTLIKWLDHVDFRDKIVKIVLTWLSSFYHDFELNPEFSYLFFRLLESRLLNYAMNNQLHLLHVTLSTKSKIRHVTISRSSREQPLSFSIAGGYEKNCGIFVTQVHGSNSDESSPQDSLIKYLNQMSYTISERSNSGCPTVIPRLRSNNNTNGSSNHSENVSKIFSQLRPGDQILEVNGTNFAAIKLIEAQKKLDMSTHLALTVRYNPSAFYEMRALPEGRRKSSVSSVSPYPQNTQKFTFNLNEHNYKAGPDHYPPISPLFSTNANFGFRSIIKNAPKNDRSRLFSLINSSKQIVKQIRDSTAQSSNVEALSKIGDNTNDGQSNEIDGGKTKSGPESAIYLKSRDKQIESGLLNVVRSDDLNTPSLLDNATNGSQNQTSVNVLRVFNAANNDSRYLLVHEETTAREVVMVAVKEFNLSGGMTTSQASSGERTISSLNWYLYEVSVVPESRTIKQKCLSEQTSRLAERASLCSRFYIKNNSLSSIGPTKLDMDDDSLVNEILKENPANVTLTSLNTTLLAVELTLADFDKFRNIEPQQFVYDTFFDCSEKQNSSISGSISSHDSASLKSSSSDSQESSDSLHSLNKTRQIPKSWMQEYHKFADISNREMFWVICEILNERNIGRRVKIVKQFVRVADVCSQLRNYNSMFAIISGLGHSCVARLKRTFEKLKPKYKNQLEMMRSLFDPSKNMSNYRVCLSQSQPPAIPLFPQIKKDLTFTKEGRSIFVRESNDLSDDDETGFSQDTIKRKSRGELLTVKSATMNAINGANEDNPLASTHSRSVSYSNFNNPQAHSTSDPDSILINFAEIRQFTDRVKNVIYFSSVPYSNDLLTNTKDNQRTQAQIKKMHEEWQMRKRIRHYISRTLEAVNTEVSSQKSSSCSRTQSHDALDQVDGVSTNKHSTAKFSITYDERVLYQKSLEVESETNIRTQTVNEQRHLPNALSPTVQSTQSIPVHLPPPQIAPILTIPQQLQPLASTSSPTLSKSSSLSSCSSFSHQLPNSYHPARCGSNLVSGVGKFGTESTESLRKLQALSENVDDWRSSSCNSGTYQNNGLSRVTSDGRGGLTRNLVSSRIFPPKNVK